MYMDMRVEDLLKRVDKLELEKAKIAEATAGLLEMVLAVTSAADDPAAKAVVLEAIKELMEMAGKGTV